MDELKEQLKTLLRKAINNEKDGDEKGEWITINGTHVFIPEGKTAEDVIKEKGWKEKGPDTSDNPKEDKPKANEGLVLGDLNKLGEEEVYKRIGKENHEALDFLYETFEQFPGEFTGKYKLLLQEWEKTGKLTVLKTLINHLNAKTGDNIKVNINPHKEGKSSG